MSKHKDFKNLFGCDDSDEENSKDLSSSVDSTNGLLEAADNYNEDVHMKSKQSLKHSAENLTKEKQNRNKSINEKDLFSESEDRLQGKRTNNEDYLKKKRLKIEHDSKRINKKLEEESKSRTSSVQHDTNGAAKKKVRLKKTEIGGLVVKLLTPAYVERRFDSKDTFKTLARNISHALYDKGKYNHSV